jgi:hypothetical protein
VITGFDERQADVLRLLHRARSPGERLLMEYRNILKVFLDEVCGRILSGQSGYSGHLGFMFVVRIMRVRRSQSG